MKQWYLKHFKKKVIVKVRIYYQDKRARTYYVIPEGETVSIGDKSFTINKNNMILENGIPTFIYNSTATESINPLDFKGTELHTPETFNVALKSKIMREFLSASGNNMNITTILAILSLIATVFVGLLLYSQINSMKETINQLNEVLQQLTGGV